MGMNRDEVRVALKKLSAARLRYQTPRAYYDGEHRLLFATQRFRSVFGDLFSAFSDNFCAPVVDTVVERLEITGFTDTAGGNAHKAAEAVWQANRMAGQVSHLHTEALVEGDAYIIVWPDETGLPVIHLNRATRCTVVYKEETPWVIDYAIKVWRVADGDQRRARLNVYYRDRIERYVTRGAVQGFPVDPDLFVEYGDDGDQPVIPHQWGVVPVFHFANKARIGAMGVTELRNAIPLNDAVNKLCADMLVGSEFVAMPQRWATGVADDIDPVTGKKRPPFEPGVERLFTTENHEARFGEFTASDFKGPIDLMHTVVQHLAATTGTPAHTFYLDAGEWPSGEALKTAEARLVKKADNRITTWSPVWADAVTLALRMAGAAPDATLDVEWAPTETRIESVELGNAETKVRLGVSRRRVLLELGYTDKEVDTILEETRQERLAIAEAQRAAFDAGVTS